jgi:hypothetical protein
MTGYIYMIHLENRGRIGMELYKIGKTTDPKGRLSSLIREFGVGIKFVAVAWVPDYNTVESILLKKYSNFAFKGVKWGRTYSCECTELLSMTDIEAKQVIKDINHFSPEGYDIEYSLNHFNGEEYKNLQLCLSKVIAEGEEEKFRVVKAESDGRKHVLNWVKNNCITKCTPEGTPYFCLSCEEVEFQLRGLP